MSRARRWTRKRHRMHADDPKCFWCGRETKLITIGGNCRGKTDPLMATLDHLRSRLNPKRVEPQLHPNERRIVLACWECNQRRNDEETALLPLEELHRRANKGHRDLYGRHEANHSMITEFRGDHWWLSNFYPCEIELDGEVYASVEHAYQAAKTLDPEERRQIRELPRAASAKRAGRRLTRQANWDSIREERMYLLLQRKFQHPDLRQKLLATGTLEIIEGNTWGDTYWGVCRGVGENRLGKMLMQLRADLQVKETELQWVKNPN